ncbi:MAG TPA: hypothetical protein VI689_00425 [Acidimicrobiia bacterium]|nr:hypothetical protein [Acidimicrobiia bacterium]
MNDFLVIVHVLSAATWIGSGVFSGFAGSRMAREGAPAALGWARVSKEAGLKVFNPAAFLTALSGILLVLVSDVYGWGDAFVTVGLIVVVMAGVIGGVVHRPDADKMITALERADYETAASLGKRAAIWGSVTIALLIVTVSVMVMKTGAG